MTRTIDDLPGPRAWPLVGNALQARPDRLHLAFERWCDRYGPLFRIDLGPRRVLVTADLDTVNELLRDRPDGFRRWSEIDMITADTGFEGVFSAEGDTWRRSRRLVVTALNSNHLQRYYEVVHTATRRLHGRLTEAVRAGRELDITDELTSFSVDVTSALAFGHDLNTLERRDNALQGHIQVAFAMAARRILVPIPYWRFFRLPADRRFDRSIAELNRAVHGFIAQARERMAARPQLHDEPENFLESMLAAQAADEGAFTDDEIVGNTFTLLLAGEDTTAHTMAWTLWLLAGAPDVQERWAQEATDVLGDERYPDEYDTIARFDYGERVLREAMRLKAVAPVIFLEALSDTEIAGVAAPKGTKVALLTRKASIASEPTLHAFDPARDQPGPQAFLAFGAGPRFCPGRNLAFLESTSAMAMIARNFEVSVDRGARPVTEHLSFTMVPKGLKVRLRER
jgi:cytochrome P450